MSGESRFDRFVPDRLRTEVSTVGSVVDIARQQNLTHVAAGVAYYAFVSTIPLLLLVLAVVSFLGSETLADHVVGLIGQQLSSSGEQVVAQMLTDSSGRGTASLVGFLVLTWSALRLFRGLKQGVEAMYPDAARSSLLDEFRDALVVGFGLVVAVTLVAAVNVVLSIPSLDFLLADALGMVVLVVVLVLALLPIYYVLPPVETSVRGVVAGAVVAAFGWVFLQMGFQVYVSSASQYGAYGVIGALLLFVTWLYFASIIVLLGAAVNAARQGAEPSE